MAKKSTLEIASMMPDSPFTKELAKATTPKPTVERVTVNAVPKKFQKRAKNLEKQGMEFYKIADSGEVVGINRKDNSQIRYVNPGVYGSLVIDEPKEIYKPAKREFPVTFGLPGTFGTPSSTVTIPSGEYKDILSKSMFDVVGLPAAAVFEGAKYGYNLGERIGASIFQDTQPPEPYKPFSGTAQRIAGVNETPMSFPEQVLQSYQKGKISGPVAAAAAVPALWVDFVSDPIGFSKTAKTVTALPELLKVKRATKNFSELIKLGSDIEKAVNAGEDISKYVVKMDKAVAKSGDTNLGDMWSVWKEHKLPTAQEHAASVQKSKRPFMEILPNELNAQKSLILERATAGQAKAGDAEALKAINDELTIRKTDPKWKAYEEFGEAKQPYAEDVPINTTRPTEGDNPAAAIKKQEVAAKKDAERPAVVIKGHADMTKPVKEKTPVSWGDWIEYNLVSTIKSAHKYGGEKAYNALKAVQAAPSNFGAVLSKGRSVIEGIDPISGLPKFARDEAGNFITDNTVAMTYIMNPVADVAEGIVLGEKQLDNVETMNHYIMARNSLKTRENGLKHAMPEWQAKDIIAKTEALPNGSAYEDAAARYFAAQDKNLDYAVNTGFVGEKDAARMRQAYKKGGDTDPDMIEFSPLRHYYGEELTDKEKFVRGEGVGRFKTRKGAMEGDEYVGAMEQYAIDNTIGTGRMQVNAAKRTALKSIEENGAVAEVGKFKAYDPESNVAYDGRRAWEEYLKDVPEDSRLKKLDYDEITAVRDVEDGTTVYRFYEHNNPILQKVFNGADIEDDILGGSSTIINMLQWSKEQLRTGVTAFPAFAIPNFIRDTMSRMILDPNTDPNTLKAILNATKTEPAIWKDILFQSPFFVALQNAGLGGQGIAATQLRRNMAAHMTKAAQAAARKGENPNILSLSAGSGSKIKNAIEYSERINNIGELIPRVRSAYRAYDKTGDIYAAARAANEYSADFKEAGALVRKAGKVIPFFPAAIAGKRTVLRAFTDPKTAPQAFYKAFKYITVPTIANWYRVHNQPWYQKKTVDERNAYMWIAPDVALPKPFELGAVFGSMVERTLDMMYQIDPQGVDNMVGKEILLGLFGDAERDPANDVPLGDVLGSIYKQNRVEPSFPAQQMVQGMLTKKNPYFKSPIESQYEQDTLPSLRGGYGTPKSLQFAAEKVPALFDTTRISPDMANFLGQAQFASGWKEAVNAADIPFKVADMVKGKEKLNLKDIRNIPVAGTVVGRFYKPQGMNTLQTDQMDKSVESMSKMWKNYSKLVQSGNEARSKKYGKKHIFELNYYDAQGRAFNSAAGQLYKKLAEANKIENADEREKAQNLVKDDLQYLAKWYLQNTKAARSIWNKGGELNYITYADDIKPNLYSVAEEE